MLKAMSAMPAKSWLLLLIGIAVFTVALDQYTKWAIQDWLAWGQRFYVTPFFDLTLLYNKGAAWSFLSDAGGWQRYFFTGISLIASIGITYWMVSLRGEQRLLAFALSFVLGGAVGNLIDRALYGQVTDFLLFHWNESYFPAFNVADSAITLGAILLIYDSLFNQSAKDTSKDD